MPRVAGLTGQERKPDRLTLRARSGGNVDWRYSVYAVRLEVRRVRRLRMTCARARKASFASRAPGNTAATSGSSVTTMLPFAYRGAYLFGRARLKSYSGRSSLTAM